jgi:asparagine synthase (glutamine-hydrolysing)
MTHFDFKTLLPALLQVEDRMSMAHGLESRVPILDHPLIEFVATIPSNVKFEDGNLKHLLKTTFHDVLSDKILDRKDKMGFPVPLNEWMKGDLCEFLSDIFSSRKAKQREYINPKFDVRSLINTEGKFSRKLWGLLCLELWQQEFHDKSSYYSDMLKEKTT